MLKTDITAEEIDVVEDCMKQFVQQYQNLFGNENMTSIIHQLLHLPNCARQFGPIWCYSGFTFEDENGNIAKFIRAPYNILSQISERLTFKRNFYDIELLNSFVINSRVKEFILSSKKKTYQNRTQIEKTYRDNRKQIFNLFGPIQVSDERKETISIALELNLDEVNCQEFKQMEISNVLYKSEKCKQLKTTDDRFIKFKDNTFARINSILLIEDNIYIELSKYKKVNLEKNLPAHFTAYAFTKKESVKFYKVEQIAEKAIAIYYNNDYIYLTTMPNMFESD